MRWVLALLLAGCGRLGFEATGGDDVIGDGGIALDGMQPGQQTDAGSVVPSPLFVTSAEASAASAAALGVDVAGVQIGDVIIVSIGWRSGTNQPVGLIDSNGNTYADQGGITRSNNAVSQQLFTATVTIAVAPTRVTATMATPAPNLSVRVLVYRGVTIFGNGTSQAQTANATTPILPFQDGAIAVSTNTALALSTTPCGACTVRMTTAFGDLAVERVFPTAGGLQSVSVGLASSAPWVMGHIQLIPQ